MLITRVDLACVQVKGGSLKVPLVALDSKVTVLKRSCKRKTTFSEHAFFPGTSSGPGFSFSLVGALVLVPTLDATEHCGLKVL